MRLASVSKSITAAVVVKELAVKQIPLTTPLVDVLGLPPSDYSVGLGNVTVLDTLRMLGGFRGDTLSYLDHLAVASQLPGATLPIDGSELLNHARLMGYLQLSAPNGERYWGLPSISQIRYSNPGYTFLGEIIPAQTGFSYSGYTQVFLNDLGVDIHPDPEHREAIEGPIRAAPGDYLIDIKHPYRNDMPIPPAHGMASLPTGNPWRGNSAPTPDSPRFSSDRYAGGFSMGGAPLAAGGWVGDGESLARLIRAIVRGSAMPIQVSDQLHAPQWANMNNCPAPGWAYGLGWYLRGNWVAMAGGGSGGSGIALHNRAYDVTVVVLTNSADNLFASFANPLFQPPDNSFIESMICIDEKRFPEDECNVGVAY